MMDCHCRDLSRGEVGRVVRSYLDFYLPDMLENLYLNALNFPSLFKLFNEAICNNSVQKNYFILFNRCNLLSKQLM